MRKFLFFLLLILSNIFLFSKGFWFYQDQSFWSKNTLEAFLYLNTQLQSFNNLSYYMGYDQGILFANNITVYLINYLFVYIMGPEGSQIAASLFGYILAFISFYFFASLFFAKRNIRFLLALLFTFNPFLYSFRGYGYIYAVAPLFVYSFYRFYHTKEHRGLYLLLNLFSLSLWIANVRFMQLNAFIAFPYLLYLLFHSREKKINYKLLFQWLGLVSVLFLPVIYRLAVPFFEKSLGIFNYGVIYNGFVGRGYFYEMFNPFQSANIFLYQSKKYVVLGILFFIIFLISLLKYIKKDISRFLLLNIVLMLLGMSFFEMGYIVGRDLYSILIKFVPFLTNAPHYGLYIANIPMVLLIGIVAKRNNKIFLSLAVFFIIVSLFPLLNLSNESLKKYAIDDIPQSYRSYFIEPYYGIPESTQYYPYACWRANYMKDADTPTQCFNRGIHYMPIVNDNPRAISGLEYAFFKEMYLNPHVDNMRVTHNLKNVIIAKDIAQGNEGGPLYNDGDKKRLESLNDQFLTNKKMVVKQNDNFAHYYYKDKDKYDFFLYSPRKVVTQTKIDTLFDNNLHIEELPVVFMENHKIGNIQKNVSVEYKQSPYETTLYYFKLSEVNQRDPFLLHLTQSFKQGWSIVWISKNEYDSLPCITQYDVFPITKNRRCGYANKLINLSIITFLFQNTLSNEQHLLGNYIANTWIVRPQGIPAYAKSDNSVYGIIIYKNQIYYIITLIVSAIVLLSIIIYTLMQEVHNRKKR